jgi:hypothetical protein
METTVRPLTAPPRRAICRALLRLVVAAAAVRMFARIETNIPIYPAIAEQSAPVRKDSVTRKAVPSPIALMFATSRFTK